MTTRLGMLTAIACLVACCTVHETSEDLAVSHELAKQVWQHNMTIVDASIDVWKRRSGTYDPKELENAIGFFEKVTNIKSGNMTFIGPIPDETLEKNSSEWKAWYMIHGEHLTYELSKRRVVVED